MPLKKQSELISSIKETAEQPIDQSLLLSLVGYNCRLAYVNIIFQFKKRMSKLKLGPVDFTVLSLLKSNPNISQNRLSNTINVSPPNLATLLDRLEKRGLLIRQRNPLDKRSQTLVLTIEGTALCNKAEKTVLELETIASSALSEEEKEQLIKLLQKIS
jgi:DNA-binding MarR family transcriptional regulator